MKFLFRDVLLYLFDLVLLLRKGFCYEKGFCINVRLIIFFVLGFIEFECYVLGYVFFFC